MSTCLNSVGNRFLILINILMIGLVFDYWLSDKKDLDRMQKVVRIHHVLDKIQNGKYQRYLLDPNTLQKQSYVKYSVDDVIKNDVVALMRSDSINPRPFEKNWQIYKISIKK